MENRFAYEKGDISFKKSQCEFCRHNREEDPSACFRYPDGKPAEIRNTDRVCPYLFDDNPVELIGDEDGDEDDDDED